MAFASLFVVVVCLLIVAVDSWRTVRARRLQLHEGEIAASNLSRAIAQHATSTLKEADTVLVGLVDRLQADGLTPAAVEGVHRLLVQYAKTIPQLQRLTIVDGDGRWLTTSLPSMGTALDVSGREYFQHHRSVADDAVHVGPPIQSKSSNQWILTLSRRINRADGGFAGLVLASIELDYFSRFYAQLDVGPQGTLTLVTTDGVLLDRRPARDEIIGSSIAGGELFRTHLSKRPQGSTTSVSSIDGIERQISFMRLDPYPLVVVAGIATRDTLAEWRSDATTHTAFMALLVLALGFVGFRLVGLIRHRENAAVQLRDSRIELEALNDRLQVLATRDGLTGLANRRELDRVLAAEIARAGRTHLPLTLILFDIDHFKLFNDHYGHAPGDDCLRRVGAAFGPSVGRPGDLAARYGGEEFAVVLPNVDAAGARVVAEKLRQAVRDLDIAHRGSPKGIVTVSAGIAVFMPRHDKTTPDALIHCADLSLYRAKRDGRDTVGSADAGSTPPGESARAGSSGPQGADGSLEGERSTADMGQVC